MVPIDKIYWESLISVKSMYYAADHTYPDLDTGASGSTKPVAVGAEAQGINDVPAI